jgi:hypothetical protein
VSSYKKTKILLYSCVFIENVLTPGIAVIVRIFFRNSLLSGNTSCENVFIRCVISYSYPVKKKSVDLFVNFSTRFLAFEDMFRRPRDAE